MRSFPRMIDDPVRPAGLWRPSGGLAGPPGLDSGGSQPGSEELESGSLLDEQEWRGFSFFFLSLFLSCVCLRIDIPANVSARASMLAG